MESKKITTIFLVILLIIIVGGSLIIKTIKENKNQKEASEISEMTEYTPQEEISEEQVKQTIVSLYFLNKDTKEVAPEARLVNITDIVNSPYDTLINLLISGPKSEKQEVIIPENTKLLKTYMEGDIITLDFSSEFLNYDKTKENSKQNLINSIVSTLTQLTEINKVKILIDGNSNNEFNEVYTI